MTVSVVLGLALQAAALFIVRTAIRGQWLRHTGALLLLIATAYHGLTEVIQAIFPGRNRFYRDLVPQDAIDNWIILVSVALLLYAVAYAAALRRRCDPAADAAPVSISAFNLKWLLLLTVPLVLLALQGAAFVDTTAQSAPDDGYVVGGLVVEFLVFVAAVTGAVAVVRLGTRWVLPILLIEAALLSAIGTRTTIVAVCIMVLYGAALAGARPPRKQLTAAVLVVALLAMVVSSTRAAVGRDAFEGDRGAGDRLSALTAGAAALPSAAGVDAVLDDFVYRLDGNAFGAAVLESLDEGAQPVGVATIVDSVLLAVPSALYPAKLDRPVIHRSEKSYYIARFQELPTNRDLLPTIYGTMLGFGGPVVFLLLAALLGLGMARLDRWLTRTASPVVFLLSMGVVQAVLTYERATNGAVLALRGVLLLALVLAIGRWLLVQRHGRATAPASPAAP